MRAAWATATLFALVLVLATTAAAQGKKGSPPGHLKHPDPGDAASASPASSSIRSIYLGSWMDDASVLPKGQGWVSTSIGYWKIGSSHIVDAPVIDMAVGASKRTQFGFSVPVYHVPAEFGPPTAGVGQYFFYGKVSLIDPAPSAKSSRPRSIGVAISPLVEVTSPVFETDGRQHVSWAAPVNLELRRGTTRAYGSFGYFSRGALFGAAAIDVPISPGITLTPSVGHTFSTSADATAGGSRHRTDLSLTASRSLPRGAALFGSIGESIAGSPTAGEARSVLWFAGGVAVTIK
jgi:hypothetical protein